MPEASPKHLKNLQSRIGRVDSVRVARFLSSIPSPLLYGAAGRLVLLLLYFLDFMMVTIARSNKELMMLMTTDVDGGDDDSKQ